MPEHDIDSLGLSITTMTSGEDSFGTYTEGFIPFVYQNQTYQTYYKLYGTLDGRTHDPLVTLHGGPGLTHRYLLPHADITKKYSIPVIFYDQIGNGRSSHLKEQPKSFWTLDLFADELANLLQYFGIQNSFNILGHSVAGGAVVLEHIFKKQRPGLNHLVLANAAPDVASWMKSTAQLLEAFPPEVVEDLKLKTIDPQRFYAALKIFHAQHGCIVKPLPKEYTESFDAVFGPDGDSTVSTVPLLTNYSATKKLHEIRATTLVMNGRMDIVQDFVCAPFLDKIPRAKWVRFENSSHTPFWEERERYMQVLGGFLTSNRD